MWIVNSDNIQMANFVWFFALLCLQISRGEELSTAGALSKAGESDTIQFPDKDTVQFEGSSEQKSAEEEWTEEDEKWFQQIQDLLTEDSDEDYDVNDVEFGKLIQGIEKLMNEYYPEKGSYEWLQEIASWFNSADDDDVDGSDYDDDADEGLASFYSWIYQKNAEKAKRNVLLQKRFSSV